MKNLLLATAVLVCGWSSKASAETIWVGGTNDAGDVIVVGCTTHNGEQSAWACIDGTWQEIDESCTLANDIAVFAFNGNDVVRIVRSTSTWSCGDSSQSWSALTLNGHYIWASGENNDDWVYGRSGPSITLHGGAGADYLYEYCGTTECVAEGDTGNDYIVGYTSGEEMYGEDGVDCLEDVNYGWDVMDCGGDAGDTYDNNGQAGTVTGCPTQVAYCDFG